MLCCVVLWKGERGWGRAIVIYSYVYINVCMMGGGGERVGLAYIVSVWKQHKSDEGWKELV